jgi:hypothetical protein
MDAAAICVVTVFLLYVMIKAASAMMPNLIRRQLRLRTVFSILSAPARGIWRLLNLTAERELTLATHQVILTDFPLTPLEFFAFVEDVLTQRQIPGVYASLIARRQVGLLSQRRWYLHVSYQTSLCIIGAMPVGNAFVISWRSGEVGSWAHFLFLEHPNLRGLADWFLRPPTFYRIDVNTAFQQLARQAVLDAVDEITEARGFRPLNETQRQRIMVARP